MGMTMTRRGGAAIQMSDDHSACFVDFSHDRANGTDPLPVRVEAIPLVFDGRLHNRLELCELLGIGGQSLADISNEEVLRRLYLEKGQGAFALLHGDYAMALYDGRNRALFLAGDIVGARPLGFHASREFSIFASDNKAILAHPGVERAPNDSALSEALIGAVTGASRRGESLFQGISDVQRGQLVVIRDGVVLRSKVREFDLTPHESHRRYPDLCEEFEVLFNQAVLRCLDPRRPSAITVSGGLDSSSIYCVARAAAEIGRKSIGINFTAEDGGLADERYYTDAIHALCGGDVFRAPLQPDGFLASLDERIEASENFMVIPAGNLFKRQYEIAKDQGCVAFLTGFWGDEAFSPTNHWYHLFWSMRLPSFIRAAREHHRWIMESPATAEESMLEILRGTLSCLIPPKARRLMGRGRAPGVQSNPLARGRLGVFAQAFDAVPIVWSPKGRFAHWQRDSLDSAQMRAFIGLENRTLAWHGLDVRHPFLDADLMQFMLRCNGAQLNPDGRYKGLLRDALRGTVPDTILDRRTKGDFTDEYGHGLERDVGPALRRVAAGKAVDAGYLNKPDVIRLADRLQGLTANRDSAHTYQQALDCIGLDAWLDRFVTGGNCNAGNTGCQARL